MTATEQDEVGRFETAPGGYLASVSRGVSAVQLLSAGPRASRFLLRSATRNLRFPGQRTRPEIPTRLPTLGTAAGVWADELILAFMATTRLSTSEADFDRIAGEVEVALGVLEEAGAFADGRRCARLRRCARPYFRAAGYAFAPLR